MNKIFLISIIIIILLLVGCAGAYFGAEYYFKTNFTPDYFFAHPTLAKIFKITPACPASGTPVCGTNGKNYPNKCLALQSNAGFAYDGQCFTNYENKTYGFSLKFPNSWKDFYVEKKVWEGMIVDNIPPEGPDYSGILLVFKNPQTTAQQAWQDIPIMIFKHDVWDLVSQEKIAVSAAPIGPGKIGENAKYVFAIPARWYGFTDAIGFEEAVNIVKTFKAF